MSISITTVIKRVMPLMLSISMLSISMVTAQQARNAMTKCFHHRGALSDKVVCYFVQDPICTHHPRLSDQEKSDKKNVRFFLPLTHFASHQIKKLAQQVSQRPSKGYTMKFAQVERPMRGIQLDVSYDPNEIDFTYARFDAISAHKGLAFIFHHKSILQEIQRKSEGISRLACNKTEPPRIVIDCGHGGSDSGKMGLFATQEKDVNLSIGFKVAAQLKKKGYAVYCTRSSDEFVPLDERTSFANKHKADLFISIHANGAVSDKAAGIETYWAPHALLKPQAKAADTLHQLRVKQMANKDMASKLLATHLHHNVMQVAKQKYKARDRKVKQAVAQVLLGTDMPSALVELGFLSNATEARHLASKQYHRQLAHGICNGIEEYITALKGA